MTPAASGAWAEAVALRHLQRQGLELITRNFRCRLGELDLVMQQQQMLVFVEVRLRVNTRFGTGAESVTLIKQRKLVRAAGIFLSRHPCYQNMRCRFDVVSVSKRNYRSRCDWIQNAFT
ncbi:MAG: YraN family protein [Gammaproteobacteria bacterium]|nr:YraN family protein [Gammaproteobacteria bacterium]